MTSSLALALTPYVQPSASLSSTSVLLRMRNWWKWQPKPISRPKMPQGPAGSQFQQPRRPSARHDLHVHKPCPGGSEKVHVTGTRNPRVASTGPEVGSAVPLTCAKTMSESQIGLSWQVFNCETVCCSQKAQSTRISLLVHPRDVSNLAAPDVDFISTWSYDLRHQDRNPAKIKTRQRTHACAGKCSKASV